MKKLLRQNLPALLILLVGVLFLLLGLGRGEHQTVFRKASNLCMECIGLG